MSKNKKTNMALADIQNAVKAHNDEAFQQRVDEAIRLDEAREAARKKRQALDLVDKANKTKDEAAAYKDLVLKAVDCDPDDLVSSCPLHALSVQGKPFVVPSGLLAVLGKSVAGKSFAWQYRFEYAAGSNPKILQMDEPIPGAVPSPQSQGDIEGLFSAIEELAVQHKVVIINSLTSFLIADPSSTRGSQATSGGSYAGLTATIFKLDALAKRLGILLVGVFNTAQFKDFTIDTVVGRATSALIIGDGFIARWSTRRYTAKDTNAGRCIDEGDRVAITLQPLDLGAAVNSSDDVSDDILADINGPGFGGF